MASTRLRNDDRAMIRGCIIQVTFKEREAELTDERDHLFDDVLARHLGDAKDAFDALPVKFKQQSSQIYVSVGGYAFYIRRSVSSSIPASLYHNHRIDLDPETELGKRVLAVIAKQEKVDEDRRALMNKINPILNSCTTVKKLLETWPEVKEHIPDHILAPEPLALPAVLVDDVNAAIKSMQKAA